MRFIIAILLAVIVCIGPAIRLVQSGGTDPRVFSDWDEPYYLPLVKEASAVPVADLFHLENGNIKAFASLKTPIPHRLTDVISGQILNASGLSTISFGLALDFVCTFASFLILYAIILLLAGRPMFAAATSVAVLFSPWLFSEVIRLITPDFLTASISTLSHLNFPSPAVLRGIYTQLSYPVFLTGLYCLLRGYLAPSHKAAWYFAAGTAAGLLAYIYFFAWLSLIAVVFCFLTLSFALGHISFKQYCRYGAAAMAPFIILSSPALLLLTSSNKIFSPGPGVEAAMNDMPRFFRSLWFLNPLELIIGLVALLKARILVQKNEAGQRFLLLMLAAVMFCKIPLMNLQPILGRWLTPYHFPLFYLDPLATGLVLLIVFRRYPASVLSKILPASIIAAALLPIVTIQMTEESGGEKELISYLSSETQVVSVAAMPFSQPFDKTAELGYMLLPYWIKSMTQHESISQFMSFSNERLDLVHLELLLSWIYRGELGLIASCPGSLESINNGDLLIGASAFHSWQRFFDCRLSRESSATPCELLKSFRVDRVIFEKRFSDGAPPGHYLTPLWASRDGSYSVLAFNQASALRDACGELS